MLRKFGSHLADQWMGALALFLVLGSGTAWAVNGPLQGKNTVGSADIINNEVASADIGDGRILNADLADNLVNGQKVTDGSLTGTDIANLSVTDANLAPNAIPADGSLDDGSTKIAPDAIRSSELQQSSVAASEVRDNSLRGDDIDESTLQGVVGRSFVRTTFQRATQGGQRVGGQVECAAGEVLLSGGGYRYVKAMGVLFPQPEEEPLSQPVPLSNDTTTPANPPRGWSYTDLAPSSGFADTETGVVAYAVCGQNPSSPRLPG